MINKENDDKDMLIDPKKDTGPVDIAHMDVNCHIVIKDKDTGEVLVNKRG